MKVGLLPVGDVPQGLLSRLSGRLARFGIRGEVLPQVPVPGKGHKEGPGPLRAEALVRLAAEGGGMVLAVTAVDVCAEGYEFVFGYANLGSAGAVVSIARLGDPDPDRVLDRVVKEAVHELAHTWGLAHCDSPACVMHHSESVDDADGKEEGFCENCRGRVAFGIGKL